MGGLKKNPNAAFEKILRFGDQRYLLILKKIKPVASLCWGHCILHESQQTNHGKCVRWTIQMAGKWSELLSIIPGKDCRRPDRVMVRSSGRRKETEQGRKEKAEDKET